MPNYKDGTEARIGHAVRGRLIDKDLEVSGIVLRISDSHVKLAYVHHGRAEDCEGGIRTGFARIGELVRLVPRRNEKAVRPELLEFEELDKDDCDA